MKTLKQNNGYDIPQIGFCVFMINDPDECEKDVLTAFEAGYRLIDTANAYMNERAVGRAMKKSGLPREEIFLTTKITPQDFGHEKTKKAIDKNKSYFNTPEEEQKKCFFHNTSILIIKSRKKAVILRA